VKRTSAAQLVEQLLDVVELLRLPCPVLGLGLSDLGDGARGEAPSSA
jgi:hypothetical protein